MLRAPEDAVWAVGTASMLTCLAKASAAGHVFLSSPSALPSHHPCALRLQAARRAAIEAAQGAQRWGLVLGTLGRQVGLQSGSDA